jgi:mannonate dehydratase
MQTSRRNFLKDPLATGAAAVALRSGCASAATRQRVLMKLGCQSAPSNETHLQYFARYGIRNICGYPEIGEGRLYATVDELKRLRDMAERKRISIDCVAPPFLESSHIDQTPHPAIMLANSPERDRDIEALQTLIRNCAAAGIPSIKYNLTLLGVLRTERTPGRGDAMYSTWRLRDAHPNGPLTCAGRVDADMFWERITYFLERVIPVAEEYKIRMACHPHHPGVPPQGYQGVVRVLGTVDGLKRFITIKESPYHGLNFCQGTVSEMLHDPGREIFEVIRYFGTRKKIFNVHFRNIRGHRDDFQEVYPDEGDIDFVKALQVYVEVGYPYLLMPDHVPLAANDPGGLQSFAYCYGYIRALLQAADQMG